MTTVPRRIGRSDNARLSAKRERFALPVILVVDDNEDNRELCTLALGRLGYTVEQAFDGADGLDRAKELRPTVILMDLAMPRMDGFEATRAIRETPEIASVHIIAVTAFTDAVSAQRAIAAGCNEVLQKPIAPEVLAARVEAIVAERAAAYARDAV